MAMGRAAPAMAGGGLLAAGARDPARQATTLNRRLIGLVAGGAALAVAVAAGLSLQGGGQGGGGSQEMPRAASDVRLPKPLAELPGDYGDADRIAGYLPAPAAAQPSAAELARLSQLEAQSAALQQQLEKALATIGGLEDQMRNAQPAPAAVAAPAPTVDPDADAAARSGLFFSAGTPGGQLLSQPMGGHGAGAAPGPQSSALEPGAGPQLAADPPPPAPAEPSVVPPPMAPQATPGMPDSGMPPLLRPAAARSGVQQIPALSVAAGSIIPASLITGINSDIEGALVAQVRENVYDTLTGQHLLIPQGTKLVGSYGADVIYGQERVKASFTRLIRPDGTWVALENAEAADTGGMAGLTDEVDNHWGRLIAGALLSATFSLGTSAAAGTPRGYYPSPVQGAASNAAGSVGQTGQVFAQQQLDRKPTITVRPGFSFDIIVQRDLVLTAFGEPAPARQPFRQIGALAGDPAL
ncbi:MAG: TrbI/VirB10 family protein [Dongiaceae bacterium]